MPKVTMALSAQDLENVAKLSALPGIRSRTHAVSVALSLAGFLIDRLREPDTEAVGLYTKDHRFAQIMIPEFQNLSQASDVSQSEAAKESPAAFEEHS